MAKENANNSNSPFLQAWKRLKKNKVSVLSLFFLGFILLVALLGYSITPDYTPNANYQVLELRTKPMGYSLDALMIRKNKEVDHEKLLGLEFLHALFFGKENPYDTKPIQSYRFKNEHIYVETIDDGYEVKYNIADVLYPISVNKQEVLKSGGKVFFEDVYGVKHEKTIKELQDQIIDEALVKRNYIFGSDKLGRDYFSRLLLGIRVSISVGLISVLISLVLGVTFGALAGYFRGWVDDIVMYIVNVTWSIPTLLLVFAIVLAVGRGFWQIFIAVGLTMWVEVARLVRGQVMSIREKEFIEAGHSLGFHHFRIIFIHILPNIMGPLIVIATANFAAAVLIEAGLSFLGIGVQSPTPSWGTMLKEHKNYITSTDKAFLAIIPGIAIAIMVYTINLLGNGLRDAFDVRSK